MEFVHYILLLTFTLGAPLWFLGGVIHSILNGLSGIRILLSGLFMFAYGCVVWALWFPPSITYDMPTLHWRVIGYALAFGSFLGVMESTVPGFIDRVESSSISNPTGGSEDNE